MKNQTAVTFVICVNNEGCSDSLESWKVYAKIADGSAEKSEMIRVIDDSGEDYVYPASYFMPIDLPANVLAALQRAS